MPASARPPIFEPTDLEIEAPGAIELDVQLGATRGDPSRMFLPDVELDIGLLPNLELSIDGAVTYEGPEGGALKLHTRVYDSLWTAIKFGLLDDRTPDGQAWVVGGQVGPRFAIASDMTGLGYEAVALVGRMWPQVNIVLNTGLRIDPTVGDTVQHGTALEGGVDASVQLWPKGSLSCLGELAGTRSLSGEPHQAYATGGLSYAVAEALDVSLVGLVGFLGSVDRHGALIGFSPKFRLWK